MASDPKIRRLARLIVEKHGDEALAVVTERIVGRLIALDYAHVRMWTRVAEAVHALHPGAPPQRLDALVQAPLDELMDDPLMDVVVQDDDDRRREVHHVLRTVKRRRREDER